MSNGVYEQEWTPKVTVPVRRVGESWELFYGGDVPVRDGEIADLVIDASQITDNDFLAMVSAETVAKIFHQGTRLLVALSDQSAGRACVETLPWPDVPFENVPMGTTRFEYVVIGPPRPANSRQQELIATELGGGLWLRLKGLERSELECSTVILPEGLPENSAVSLNHAFTLLSQRYEQHRISHTGNVYSRVFYMEENAKWYPLAHLREGVRVRAERGLISSIWDQIETKLGWCRLPPEPKQLWGGGDHARAIQVISQLVSAIPVENLNIQNIKKPCCHPF